MKIPAGLTMALFISTGAGVVEYGIANPFWDPCGRVCRCMFFLGALQLVLHCCSLLKTLW